MLLTCCGDAPDTACGPEVNTAEFAQVAFENSSNVTLPLSVVPAGPTSIVAVSNTLHVCAVAILAGSWVTLKHSPTLESDEAG